jgi:hypothetical protein
VIVEDKRALARDRREQTALFEERRAPGIERQGSADEHDEDAENEDAARRVGRKGMDGREHARSHQKSPNQRQREGDDRKQNSPDFQSTALFHHHGGMQ